MPTERTDHITAVSALYTRTRGRPRGNRRRRLGGRLLRDPNALHDEHFDSRVGWHSVAVTSSGDRLPDSPGELCPFLKFEQRGPRFDRLWHGGAEGAIEVLPLPAGLREMLQQRAEGTDWRELVDELSAVKKRVEAPELTVSGRRLLPQQSRGLQRWRENGRRGILAHATGAGKTVTGICAVGQHDGPTLVVAPTEPIANQWPDQIRQELGPAGRRVHLCGAGEVAWKTKLRTWMTDPRTNRIAVAVAVAPSAASTRFLAQLANLDNLLFVGAASTTCAWWIVWNTRDAPTSDHSGSPDIGSSFQKVSATARNIEQTPRRTGASLSGGVTHLGNERSCPFRRIPSTPLTTYLVIRNSRRPGPLFVTMSRTLARGGKRP